MHYIATRIFNILAISLLLNFFPTSAKAEIIDKIVAQVGDKIVTLYDIEIFAPALVKSIYSIPNTEEQKKAWAEYYNAALEKMIFDVVLETAAAREGVTVAEPEIDEMIVILNKEDLGFRNQVKNILDREGTVTPELKIFVKHIIIQERIKPIIFNRALITDEDVKKYIKENGGNFNSKFYHVKLAFFDEEAIYKNFLNNIKNKKTFEEAVANTSDSIIDMGWVAENDMIPEIADKVKKMKKNDLSSPIVDGDGTYAVVKLIDTKIGENISDRDLEVAKNKLFSEHLQQVYQNWIEKNKRSIIVSRFDQ